MFSPLLSLIQSYCREYALPVPSALQGSNDSGAQQLRELMQTTGEYIWEHTNWEQCSRRVVFSAPGTPVVGTLAAICPENYSHIVPNTFWDNSLRRPLCGPVADHNWQSQQALTPPGPLYYFRVANSQIETSSTIPAGHKLSLIYKSKDWVRTSAGVGKQTYSLDDDTSVFSDSLMKAGLRAHWLRAKQMPHAYEFERFQLLVENEGGKNAVRPVLHTDESYSTHRPGLLIPIGNWTVAP
jgi:hypothetical protein